MTDRAVPNLPSRDLAATAAFYGGFGFHQLHRDDNWLVLRRGDLQLEFFRKDDHEPHRRGQALQSSAPSRRISATSSGSAE